MRDFKTAWLLGTLVVLMAAWASAEEPPAHETFTIESAVLGETRVINVYLPPEYEADGDHTYPVLYMPDGGLQEDFPHIALSIDAGIRDGEMRPLILVGIENTDRRRDMSGPTEAEFDKKVVPNFGGSANFRRFMGEELFPRVGSRYRVDGQRGIIGESAAGLFIVETFFLEPGLFDTYLAVSPALWWNDEHLVRHAASRLAAFEGEATRLYLTSANETDIAPQVARLAEALEEHAPPTIGWTYVPRPDLEHGTIYRATAPSIMRAHYQAKKEGS